jgi:hypothetical protein
MKIQIALPTLLLLGAAGVAGAQEEETVAERVLFHWDNWETGTLYALLGLTGALVTMFSLIGGAVPGTAGKARIDAETAQIDRLYQRLFGLAESPDLDPQGIKALNDTIDKMRDDLRRERWRQFGLAFVFYTILGAIFASALAYDHLQAIVIGAGWTGYLGAVGLKGDFAERQRIKNESLDAAGEVVSRLGRGDHTPVSPALPAGLRHEELVRLDERLSIARKL